MSIIRQFRFDGAPGLSKSYFGPGVACWGDRRLVNCGADAQKAGLGGPQAKSEAKVTVSLFTTQDGQRGHLVQVEGHLSIIEALCLAIQALVDRLMKFIW